MEHLKGDDVETTRRRVREAVDRVLHRYGLGMPDQAVDELTGVLHTLVTDLYLHRPHGPAEATEPGDRQGSGPEDDCRETGDRGPGEAGYGLGVEMTKHREALMRDLEAVAGRHRNLLRWVNPLLVARFTVRCMDALAYSMGIPETFQSGGLIPETLEKAQGSGTSETDETAIPEPSDPPTPTSDRGHQAAIELIESVEDPRALPWAHLVTAARALGVTSETVARAILAGCKTAGEIRSFDRVERATQTTEQQDVSDRSLRIDPYRDRAQD